MSISKHNLKIFFAVLGLSAFVCASAVFWQPVDAEEIDPNAVAKLRQQKEEELKNLESQIENIQSTIEELQRGRTTLERDIAIMDAQIAKAKLEIKARDLSIAQLAGGIEDRSQIIKELAEKLDQEKASLAELLRRVNELDSTSLIEIVMGYDKLSDFFADSDNFESIQQAIQDSFDEIKQTKSNTEAEKQDLENKKSEQMELRSLQALEKKRQEEAEANKKSLLKQTKGQEQTYQKLLASRQKDAATIRSQLFILNGSPAIPFEKALEYANAVSKITGVRPAFLLGVISEESNLGANVGTGNWKNELAHSSCVKQRDAFAELTASLGLDPDLMPISKKAWYGYCGGAMGPAQFIPTTWQLYSDRVAKITGHNPPNPWDPYDAFAAAALYLKDSGGFNGKPVNAESCTYKWCIANNECKAALKYLAGSNWNKSAYSFYGCDVMALAAKYQEQINILSGS